MWIITTHVVSDFNFDLFTMSGVTITYYYMITYYALVGLIVV